MFVVAEIKVVMIMDRSTDGDLQKTRHCRAKLENLLDFNGVSANLTRTSNDNDFLVIYPRICFNGFRKSTWCPLSVAAEAEEKREGDLKRRKLCLLKAFSSFSGSNFQPFSRKEKLKHLC